MFGRVMPFWMAGSTLLNLLLLLPFQHLNGLAWRLDAIAFAIQILAVLFSLLAPLSINTWIASWTVVSLPDHWRREERRWDFYHWLKASGLLLALVLLTLSLAAR
jgi:hypothetical protein